MSKEIHITFSNGVVYSVPAKFVAEHRADYYASKFEGEEGMYEEIFDDEMWVLDDEKELVDWMSGHMDWVDVEEKATLSHVEGVDKSDEFTNSKKELIE
jgi:hypothetical protein